MQSTPISATLTLVILLQTSLPSRAQVLDGQNATFGFQTDFASRYVSRGLGFTQGPVEQSRVWMTISNLTIYGWTNLVVAEEPQQGEINEVDFGIAYMREWKGLTWEPAADCYWYPKPRNLSIPKTPPTGEVSLKASHPVGLASLFAKYAADIGSYRGSYFGEVGVSSEQKWSSRLTSASSARLGWASAKFAGAYTDGTARSFSIIGLDVSLTYALGRQIYIRPHFEWTVAPGTPSLPMIGSAGVAFGFDPSIGTR